MQHWWNDNERVTPKYSEKNVSLCHFIHTNPHRMAWGQLRLATNHLSHGMARTVELNILEQICRSVC